MRPITRAALALIVTLAAASAGCAGRSSSSIPAIGSLQDLAVHSASAVDTNGSDWPEFRRDDQRTGNNPYQTAIAMGNVATLAPKWSIATGGIFESPVVVNGVVYEGDLTGRLYALNIADGSQVWQFHGSGAFEGSAYYHRSTLYVGAKLSGSAPAQFYSIDAANGTMKWKYPIANGAQLSGSPMVTNGMVFQGTDAHNEALNECDANKQMLWLNASSGALVSSLNLAPTGLTGADIWASPMLDPSGNLYVATGNECRNVIKPFPYANAVLRVNPAKPKMGVTWAFQSPLGPGLDDDFGATPIFVNGMIVEPGKDGYAYALNPATGAMIWRTHIGPTIGSPATDGTRVYIPTIVNNPRCSPGAPCGAFVALNLSDGSIAWSNPVKQTNYHFSEITAPAVSNGIVYAAYNGAVWALKATDGSTLWSYPTPNNVVFGGITVVNGGVLVGEYASPGTFWCFTPGGK